MSSPAWLPQLRSFCSLARPYLGREDGRKTSSGREQQHATAWFTSRISENAGLPARPEARQPEPKHVSKSAMILNPTCEKQLQWPRVAPCGSRRSPPSAPASLSASRPSAQASARRGWDGERDRELSRAGRQAGPLIFRSLRDCHSHSPRFF